MEKEKLTAKDRVLNYIKRYGSITTIEAFSELGITRLSEYIRQLRLEMEISDKIEHRINRYGEKVKFKRYFLGA